MACEDLWPQSSRLPVDDRLLIVQICLDGLIILKFLQFPDHASEANIDEMFCGYPKDEPYRLEVEDDIDWLLGIFEYLGALIGELPYLKNGIFLLIHKLHESLDEGS